MTDYCQPELAHLSRRKKVLNGRLFSVFGGNGSLFNQNPIWAHAQTGLAASAVACHIVLIGVRNANALTRELAFTFERNTSGGQLFITEWLTTIEQSGWHLLIVILLLLPLLQLFYRQTRLRPRRIELSIAQHMHAGCNWLALKVRIIG